MSFGESTRQDPAAALGAGSERLLHDLNLLGLLFESLVIPLGSLTP